MPKNPGKEIKKLREELDLSQQRFAEKVGLSGKTISAYETGKIIPPLRVMEKIANTYNFDFNEDQKFMTKEKVLNTIRDIRNQLADIEKSLKI
ncbi:helix-turn-helix transcriptional regulator [Patescibacteria group bacterium]|nr:helix-turn-helix transcriptional regulator [Patescibacteria group bacterium]